MWFDKNLRTYFLKTAFACVVSALFCNGSASANSVQNTQKTFGQPPPATSLVGLNANTIDGVIVTVADEPLLLSEFQRAVAVATQRSSRVSSKGQLTGGQLSPADAEIILEQLINQKILSLRVRELGLNLGEDELDSELKSFLQNQNISEEKFQEILRAEGETVESHREEFRKQIETQRFIGRVIRPLVTVTEDQVRGFYMQQNADKDKTQLVKLRSLMIEIPTGLSNEEMQTKKRNIETIRRDVDAGRPFVDLVQIYSEAKDAMKTKGLLPPRPLNELPEKLRSRLKGKASATVIGPIELGLSVFFFEYLGTELGDQKEYEKQRPQYEAKLLDLKFRERLDEYLRSERLKVKISRRDFKISR
jgi:parvulin-like peptidyl-prolyl isomerase